MPTLLTLEGVSLTRGDRVILRHVDLSVSTGERLALLGRNGAGKTTLLSILGGHLKPDEGDLWKAPDVRVAELPQQPVFEGNATVAELVAAANPHKTREADLARLAARLDAEPHLLPVWAERQAAFEAAGGYRFEVDAATTLGVLELRGFERRVANTLSGGERTRLALALALLTDPDLLLLDEPTNHLDVRMREWLEGRLLAARAAIVLTSHDRDLLDRVAARSLWIEEGEASAYPGGYSTARAARDIERRTRTRAHKLAAGEYERLAGSAARERRWGRQAEALRSRAERVDVVDAPLPERKLRMRLLSGDARAKVLVWAEHLRKVYGERVVLQDVHLKIRQGDRIVLLGPNGTGKTTLLKLLVGELYPDGADAKLQFEPGVTVAYLDQTWHGLHPDAPLGKQFTDRFGEGRARALLGRANFSGEFWDRSPRDLSGGERARAGIALVGGLRADLLLLDEPTNHLDVEALEALETAVTSYGGASLIVTHDRRFARDVATRVWRIEDAALTETATPGDRLKLDPARTLQGDPPPPPPPPRPRDRLRRGETRLADLDARLVHTTLTGREEARVRSERHALRRQLYDLYADVFGADVFDHEVREGPLHVRGVKTGRGGAFYARRADGCPGLAWSGEELSWQGGTAERWFAAHLTRGALRILFEHWNVTSVRFANGRVLSLEEYERTLDGRGADAAPKYEGHNSR
ncbi:ABC-F family ATP-binding cassette domain-containing protein [Deinococcus yavapaiensis]|uniref:ATP-binding cassette subfamily F protein 3 n=1 Tax=Deinococcus yavapaiensis KR-236 TaxID=694435 RepID=A0A318SEH8_9DEIO|nr:ABC-F family ATP-binding cassette domain-containing protein [Deinococcus yavapaiensis]PYE54922.1 ATP-binding cassette subfamily F protein 3 [Deinococcus yavapaiensis KR-236]